MEEWPYDNTELTIKPINANFKINKQANDSYQNILEKIQNIIEVWETPNDKNWT